MSRLHELRRDWDIEVEKRWCDGPQCRHFADRARARGEHPTRLSAWRLVDREKAREILDATDPNRADALAGSGVRP